MTTSRIPKDAITRIEIAVGWSDVARGISDRENHLGLVVERLTGESTYNRDLRAI